MPAANHWSGFTGNSAVMTKKRAVAVLCHDKLGLSQEAAKLVVTYGGINSLDDLETADIKLAEDVIKAVMSPARGTDGAPIGALQRRVFILAVFTARVHERAWRTMPWNVVDKAWVLKYKPQYDLEKGHENPTEAEIPKFGQNSIASHESA